MNNSILDDIKKLLGIDKNYNEFDTDIIIHINSVFMILNQIGIGPTKGFKIDDNSKRWHDYLKDETDLEAIKTYIYLKVRLIFDPPINSSVIEAFKNTISELEWRLNIKENQDTIN